MRIARATLALPLLLAVVINPVMARLIPCTCHEATAQSHSCCQSKPAAKKSCCSQKANCDQPDTISSDTKCAHCGAVRDLPVPTVAHAKVVSLLPELNAADLPLLTPSPSLPIAQRFMDDRIKLSGPPLLALHCTWLK